MALSVDQVVDLIKSLAWPVVSLIGLATLRRPAADMLRSLGGRATKLSLFSVELELAELEEARPGLLETVDNLRQQVVLESGMPTVVASGGGDIEADYVVLTLGEPNTEEAWLSSRLFLLAALLENGGNVRCLAFLSAAKGFVGAATPHAVRRAMGALHPEYERVLAESLDRILLHTPAAAAARGRIAGQQVEWLARDFLGDRELVQEWRDPPSKHGWVHVQRTHRPSTLELADWLSPSTVRGLLGAELAKGTVTQQAAGHDGRRLLITSITGAAGDYVAMLDGSGAFKGLYDRRDIVERVARAAVA